MDGISRSRGWDKEIPYCVLPMELVLSDTWARKICPVDERYSCVGMRFVRFSCGLSGSHAFSILLVSCMYPLMSVPPELYSVNYRTGNKVPKTSIARGFCVRSMNVLFVSYQMSNYIMQYIVTAWDNK